VLKSIARKLHCQCDQGRVDRKGRGGDGYAALRAENNAVLDHPHLLAFRMVVAGLDYGRAKNWYKMARIDSG